MQHRDLVLLVLTAASSLLSSVAAFPQSSATLNRRNTDNFLAGNCQILWNSAPTYGDKMDLHVFDANANEIHHNNVDTVPANYDNVSFDCGLDVNCLIQAVAGTVPTFNYRSQAIPLVFPRDAVKAYKKDGADAAPLCQCSPSDKSGYSSDTWIMCTFACGPGYTNSCPHPGA